MTKTKKMTRVTVSAFQAEDKSIKFLYSVENKDLPVTNNKIYFNVSKPYYITDEPFIDVTYPMNKVVAYSMNMEVKDVLERCIKEVKRAQKIHLATCARKANTTYATNNQKYKYRMNEAIRYLEECDKAIAENRIYEVPPVEYRSSLAQRL